jgi:glutathione synthase/RimK-type ligase-like ATP-grasp enzyme
MVLGQAKVEAVELPTAVREKLLRFMRRLGLVYGAVDLRRTPSGDHVFLEINTAGEFLFVEERAGLPVSSALADWLSTPVAR